MRKISLLICLILILNAPISVYAHATATTPTVTIAAGTGAAVGGAYQGYTSKAAAAATALTIAVLSATGAAVKLTEASVQAGKTVYQVINDKFAQWVGGTSAEDLTPSQAEELQSRFKVITGGGGNSEDPDNDQNNGTNVGEDGKLWFSPGSLAMLEKFTSWLESNNQVNQYEQPSSGDTVNLGGLNVTLGNSVTGRLGMYTVFDRNVALVCQRYQRSGYISWEVYAITNESGVVGTRYSSNGSAMDTWPLNRTINGLFYGIIGQDGNSNSFPIPSNVTLLPIGQSISNFMNSITDGWQDNSSAGTEITQDGIYANENWDNSLLRNPNNQVLIVDPGILTGFNIDSDRQISIPDYLDLIIQQAEERAKRDAQPDSYPAPQELPVPLLDPITGTKSPANWIDPEPDTETIEPIESEKRDPDPEDPKDPVIDDDTPTDPEDAVELLKVDLTKIFPFCIPWDIYRILAKFDAEPVTPSITIDWGNILGSIGVDFETTLDLHDYDGIAYVLRTMETVAFVVGLAVATRSIFLQS